MFLVPFIECVTNYNCKISLWMWNAIEDYNIRRLYLAKEFAEVWTFDKRDAEKYGLHFHNEFYFSKADIHSINSNKAVFCWQG